MDIIKCSVCDGQYTMDEGGMEGYIGILEVQFCPTCYSGILDMTAQVLGVNDDE